MGRLSTGWNRLLTSNTGSDDADHLLPQETSRAQVNTSPWTSSVKSWPAHYDIRKSCRNVPAIQSYFHQWLISQPPKLMHSAHQNPVPASLLPVSWGSGSCKLTQWAQDAKNELCFPRFASS